MKKILLLISLLFVTYGALAGGNRTDIDVLTEFHLCKQRLIKPGQPVDDLTDLANQLHRYYYINSFEYQADFESLREQIRKASMTGPGNGNGSTGGTGMTGPGNGNGSTGGTGMTGPGNGNGSTGGTGMTGPGNGNGSTGGTGMTGPGNGNGGTGGTGFAP